MTIEAELPVEERICQLLEHLGIRQAHFAVSSLSDWRGLVAAHPEVISSLTLVSPRAIDPSLLSPLASRLLVFNGDRGDAAEALQRSIASLPDANQVTLHDYLRSIFADIIADRGDSIGSAMIDFLGQMNQGLEVSAVSLSEGEGEIAGISYSVRGSGPPLLLFPIEYAPSQWEPLLSQLARHYCTVTLGGAWLGVVAGLESRAQGGYLAAVQRLIDETRLQPGERVLDVGCGPGSLDRWLAHRTGGVNPIIGVDISPYILQEAAALARNEGLREIIEFREASGEALPFPDNSFDVSVSFPVIQACDADLMLGEMVRVTRPGGRIAVLANGYDLPYIINLPLGAELKTKAEAPRSPAVNPRGCGDISLYRRFHQIGLTKVEMLPQLATHTDQTRLRFIEGDILTAFSPEETEEWRTAVAAAETEGTYFIAEPFHCVVGTKPG